MWLDEEGYITKCDWCGEVDDTYPNHRHCCPCLTCVQWSEHYERSREIRDTVWESYVTLSNRMSWTTKGLPLELHGDVCRECQIKLIPWVQRFAEIYMIHLANSKLQGAIYDKRKSG